VISHLAKSVMEPPQLDSTDRVHLISNLAKVARTSLARPRFGKRRAVIEKSTLERNFISDKKPI
jgi:hypothetical protein